MNAGSDPAVLRRMRLTFELYDLAERMTRQRLRSTFPDASAEEIDQRVRAFMRSRPAAPHGDADGRPTDRFPDVPKFQEPQFS